MEQRLCKIEKEKIKKGGGEENIGGRNEEWAEVHDEA
jgi:hypothetical protein